MPKALIIETDALLISQFSDACSGRGIELAIEKDGKKGLKNIKKNAYDIIIFEILLPKVDGFEILRYIERKKINDTTQIIILTHLAHDDDIRLCKQLGAHKVCVKAFHDVGAVMNLIDERILQKA